MNRLAKAIARASLIGAALLLMGCVGSTESGVKAFHVEIEDFDTGAIAGLSFWKLDEVVGDYVWVDTVPFARSLTPQGMEVVDYVLEVPEFGALPLSAELLRDPDDPNHVELNVQWSALPGRYRVTTFNDWGDSPLSLADKNVL